MITKPMTMMGERFFLFSMFVFLLSELTPAISSGVVLKSVRT